MPGHTPAPPFVPTTVSQDVEIHDTLASGLTYKNDLTTASGATSNVTTNWTSGQEIIFTVPKENAGKTVTFTYSATMDATDTSGNSYTNTAYLKYSHFQSITQTLTTITNKLTVNKRIATEDGTLLAGAVLQLQDANGTPISLVGSGTSYRLAVSGDSNTVNQFTSSDSAATVIEGLDSDLAYKIAELKAPDGYNGLSSAQDVAASAGNDRTSNIVNKTGSVLPSTGGMGTTVIYIVGAILVIGAGVLLVTRRKMKANQ